MDALLVALTANNSKKFAEVKLAMRGLLFKDARRISEFAVGAESPDRLFATLVFHQL